MSSKKPLILVMGILLLNTKLSADVVSDGTLGTRVEVTETGTHFKISDGLQKENNLFHSFSDFSIGSTERATFTESGIPNPSLVRNILARVTGGNESRIYGQLSSEIGRADLYLINPNGIMFSENATLNVPGSFHATTADYMRLGNQAFFYANLSENSTFVSAAPAAFGFLNKNPASISINGQKVFLRVPEQKTLSVIGGSVVEIEDSVLSAPGGRINLASVASAGEVEPTSSDLKVDAVKGEIKISHLAAEHRPVLGPDGEPLYYDEEGFYRIEYGNLDVTNYAYLEGAAGQIYIRGGQLFLTSAGVFADTFDDQDEQKLSIDIAIEGEMELLNGARITADNNSESENSRGGDIIIKAENLNLSGRVGEEDFSEPRSEEDFEEEGFLEGLSLIRTSNFSDGKGGDIRLEIRNGLELSPGAILSTTGTGEAGNIHIEAKTVTLQDGMISADTVGSGHAGNITINATEQIFSDYSDIASAALEDSTGDAGSIVLNTSELRLTEEGVVTSYSYGKGNAGSIQITTDSAFLAGISDITTRAENAGGGNITLQVRENLELFDDAIITAEAGGDNPQDKGGNITISSPAIFTLDNSQLLANAYGGNGGRIDINTAQFNVLGDSRIDVSSELGLNGEFLLNSTKLRDEFLVLPPQQILSFPELQDRCAGFTRDKAGKFVITIRDVPPQSPRDLKTGTFFP
jgi:filamentous hemagglutinin family protein